MRTTSGWCLLFGFVSFFWFFNGCEVPSVKDLEGRQEGATQEWVERSEGAVQVDAGAGERAPGKEQATPKELAPDSKYDPTGRLRLPAEPGKPQNYIGTCPTFKEGENTIQSEDLKRGFQLFLPPQPKGAPLLFIWHPLGGNATQMATAFGAKQIASFYKAVVVVPHSCCSGPVRLPCCSRASEWNFVGSQVDTDLSFFDDMLSCLDKQFDIDNRRVMTTGFSAGALWSSFLVINRSEYLASAVIFSGGVGLFPYSTPRYPVPVILAWGGANDSVGGGLINFDKMTRKLIDALKKDKHFVVACNHGLRHNVPRDAGAWAFPFLFDHIFKDGKSPYANPDKRKAFPSYCSFP